MNSGDVMKVNRVIPDIAVDDLDAAREFYAGFLGLSNEEWGVRRFFVRAPDGNVFNIVAHPR